MAGWSSRAGRIVRAAAALLLLGLGAQTDMREPFGLPTVAAPEGPLWSTWRMLQRQFRVDRATIARCRDEPHACPAPAALQFVKIVEAGRAHEGLARIGNINRAVNLAIRAVSDTTQGSTRDEWTSPLAALAAGAGDCKQYAVLKYAALRDAGFAAEDLRLVILELKPRPLRHAVVALRHEGRWLVLDNRTLRLVESSAVLGHYQPLYALDRRGVWQFGKPQGPEEKLVGAAREHGS
jgi:predicted transglutaminase-like cysteine proteinase